MKRQAPERKTLKYKPLSEAKKREIEAYLLENAKQSFYAEGIEFNNEAWNWYTHKTKSA